MTIINLKFYTKDQMGLSKINNNLNAVLTCDIICRKKNLINKIFFFGTLAFNFTFIKTK